MSIDPTNGLPIPKGDQALQYRRAEKGWRYRDHERSWTQYIWGTITTAQSIVLGIFSIIASRPNSPVTNCQLTIVVLVTIVELAVVLWRSRERRSIDAMWASHFEDLVSATEDKKGYDDNGRNAACVEAERRFCETLRIFEVIAFLALVVTVLMLLRAIVCSAAE